METNTNIYNAYHTKDLYFHNSFLSSTKPDLVVTFPPYFDRAINSRCIGSMLGVFERKDGAIIHWEKEKNTYFEKYEAFLYDIFASLLKKSRAGSKFCIITKDYTPKISVNPADWDMGEGESIDNTDFLKKILSNVGLKYLQTIIINPNSFFYKNSEDSDNDNEFQDIKISKTYRKNASRGYLYSDYYKVLIFSNPKEIKRRNIADSEKIKSNLFYYESQIYSNPVWSPEECILNSRAKNNNTIFHEMNSFIVARLIRMFSFIGDNVVDPFDRGGKTALMASVLGRNCDSFAIDPYSFVLSKSFLGYETNLFNIEIIKDFLLKNKKFMSAYNIEKDHYNGNIGDFVYCKKDKDVDFTYMYKCKYEEDETKRQLSFSHKFYSFVRNMAIFTEQNI